MDLRPRHEHESTRGGPGVRQRQLLLGGGHAVVVDDVVIHGALSRSLGAFATVTVRRGRGQVQQPHRGQRGRDQHDGVEVVRLCGRVLLHDRRSTSQRGDRLHLQTGSVTQVLYYRAQCGAYVSHVATQAEHRRDLTIRFAFEHIDVLLVRRSEEHTSELQSRGHLVCRLLLEKIKLTNTNYDARVYTTL